MKDPRNNQKIHFLNDCVAFLGGQFYQIANASDYGLEFIARNKQNEVTEIIHFSPTELSGGVFEEDCETVFKIRDFEFGLFKGLKDAPLPVEFLEEEQIRDRLEDISDSCEGTIYCGYQGRGNTGRCYGITTDDPDQCIHESRSMGINGACKDSMGRSVIVYWPHLKCTKDEDGQPFPS